MGALNRGQLGDWSIQSSASTGFVSVTYIPLPVIAGKIDVLNSHYIHVFTGIEGIVTGRPPGRPSEIASTWRWRRA
jgi:hypothetical protein